MAAVDALAVATAVVLEATVPRLFGLAVAATAAALAADIAVVALTLSQGIADFPAGQVDFQTKGKAGMPDVVL